MKRYRPVIEEGAYGLPVARMTEDKHGGQYLKIEELCVWLEETSFISREGWFELIEDEVKEDK